MNPQEENIQLPTVQQILSDTDDSNQAQSSPAPATSTPPVPPVDPFAQPITVQPSVQNTSQDSPQSAGDIDLIEKAWVQKAKNIVNNTMGDPHTQSEALYKMKAEYIKKRYNKEIKAED